MFGGRYPGRCLSRYLGLGRPFGDLRLYVAVAGLGALAEAAESPAEGFRVYGASAWGRGLGGGGDLGGALGEALGGDGLLVRGAGVLRLGIAVAGCVPTGATRTDLAVGCGWSLRGELGVGGRTLSRKRDRPGRRLRVRLGRLTRGPVMALGRLGHRLVLSLGHE